MSVETSVSERYADGAKEVEPALCCPVDYDASLLKLLPKEIIDKDYGCGDPSRYVEEGDVVLDLGSGGGKICYMAAQLVGEKGAVIGIDMTDEMLDLAGKYQDEMAEKIGGKKVSFRKGYIQDLALDVRAMEAYLEQNPVKSAMDLQALEIWQSKQKKETPLVESNSVDLVVSNCVLNLVAEKHRVQMIDEIFRVLKPGGRVAISDIVSDEYVPKHLREDEHLWSGCISGAFQEEEFLQAFLDAGFVAVAYDKWDEAPWQVVEGIEFRSVTVMATKPEEDEGIDAGQAVIYKGPFAEVCDDSGNFFPRGERIAVSAQTLKFLSSGPLKQSFICINPETPKTDNAGIVIGTVRPASETKGGSHGSANGKEIDNSSSCC